MAQSNEFNQLLNQLPGVINSAIARKDRKEELQFAREDKAKREAISDKRYKEEKALQLEGIEHRKKRERVVDLRYAAQQDLNKRNYAERSYAGISDLMNSSIDANSTVSEIEDYLKKTEALKKSIDKTGVDSPFIEQSHLVNIAKLQLLKKGVEATERADKFIVSTLEYAYDEDGIISDDIKNPGDYARGVEVVASYLENAERAEDKIQYDRILHAQEMLATRKMIDDVLESRSDNGREADGSFKFTKQFSEIQNMLKDIDTKVRSGSEVGLLAAKEGLKYIGNFESKGRQLERAALKDQKKVTTKELTDELKTLDHNFSVTVSELQKISAVNISTGLGTGTARKKEKVASAAFDYLEKYGEKLPEEIKIAMSNARKVAKAPENLTDSEKRLYQDKAILANKKAIMEKIINNPEIEELTIDGMDYKFGIGEGKKDSGWFIFGDDKQPASSAFLGLLRLYDYADRSEQIEKKLGKSQTTGFQEEVEKGNTRPGEIKVNQNKLSEQLKIIMQR